MFEESIRNIMHRDDRYASDAYFFMKEALDYAIKEYREKNKSPHHLSAAELLDAIVKYAFETFSPYLAGTVLREWGITETMDFGNIVYNLIDEQIFSASAEDSPDDFKDVFDFEKVFEEPLKTSKAQKHTPHFIE